jgi:hypothetical protein
MILAAGVLAAGCSSNGTSGGAGGAPTSSGGQVNASGGTSASGGAVQVGSGGTSGAGGSVGTGGKGTSDTGGATSTAGTLGTTVGTGGKTAGTGGAPSTGGATGSTGVVSSGGRTGSGGATVGAGGATSPGSGGAAASGGSTGSCSGPIGTFSGAVATGIAFKDTDGKPVNAHGGGIIQVGDTFYMHGEYFPPGGTDNNFHGVEMYSSKDLATWKNEGIILEEGAGPEIGANRKGERPHIIKCPSTGEFVLYMHAASEDYQTDKEVVYATSSTVNGKYAYKGPLTNAAGTRAEHSDMSAVVDKGKAYVITESGGVYTLADDCHSWVTTQSFGATNIPSDLGLDKPGGGESPTVFRAGDTLYWIASQKTGWRANDNVYATAPSMTGPWTNQGLLAPSGEKTWLSQATWVTPVVGCKGTVYVYWGDHWYGTQDTTAPGKHNDQTTYVFQPIVFNGTKISLPKYLDPWKLDVGAGTYE